MPSSEMGKDPGGFADSDGNMMAQFLAPKRSLAAESPAARSSRPLSDVAEVQDHAQARLQRRHVRGREDAVGLKGELLDVRKSQSIDQGTAPKSERMPPKSPNRGSLLVMPESWQPGQNIRLPDPNDPTGKTFIEIPASEVEIVAQVPVPG